MDEKILTINDGHMRLAKRAELFELANSCHAPDSGKFCSGGGGSFVASKAEFKSSKKQANEKIRQAPVPSESQVLQAREELSRAARGQGRAGGESRGGGSKDRAKQRQNLFNEFGGQEKGYVVCPWTGLKLHWTNDSKVNPDKYPVLERGKIFTKVQGGSYRLENLLPESFAANRKRGSKPLRQENI